MYEKKTYEEIMRNNSELKEINIDNTHLIIHSFSGEIFRKMKSGFWKKIENKCNHNKGYNVILINKKQYTRAKLILYAQDKIKLSDKNVNIYHKNNDRLDCCMNNLIINH